MAGHWYDHDGNPLHEVRAANGEMRSTTLRDARKLNLFPSVTTVMKPVSGSPTLTDWITDQALLSLLNHPGGVPSFATGIQCLSSDTRVKELLKWCKDDSRKQVRDKAELGNALHDAHKASFLDPDAVPAHFLAHVDGTRSLLSREFGEDRVWHPERTWACPELGVAGQIDLDSEEGEIPILVDFKCKEFDEGKKVKSMVFDEHIMQGGGYRLLRSHRDARYKQARFVNVFISTSVPGLSVYFEHTQDDIAQGEEMFLAANAFWRATNGYHP